ncbi:hypothetical protein DPMN_067904 [Dreissena polymorpha]|uniref:Uncharacterized protein n=1 Tax=Dreissena polymorpha TaxID=45954 RepID=A0A9D4BW68_DREPO|nr:hypothetical protein DPMN_067904 [Dreissena polymorpha]
MLSETLTPRILKRLDSLDEHVFNIRNDVIESLRDELRKLRKDLKEKRDFRIEDISTLSNRLTGSSGQLVRHDEEQVFKVQQGTCDCGAILSKYESLMMAFKREKSENIMLRKEFHEMRKQHGFEIGNVSEKFNNMDSRLNNAEKTLRSEIDTIKNEKMAQLRSEIITIKEENNCRISRNEKHQDF